MIGLCVKAGAHWTAILGYSSVEMLPGPLFSKLAPSCRRLLITVELQLPWVQPELQWPFQLLPVLTRWLQSEHRAQHELPVQIKAQTAPSHLLHLCLQLVSGDCVCTSPVAMSTGAVPTRPRCRRCHAVRCGGPWDPCRDPSLAVFGTPCLQWFVSCHYTLSE